jgi:hypothetical protein
MNAVLQKLAKSIFRKIKYVSRKIITYIMSHSIPPLEVGNMQTNIRKTINGSGNLKCMYRTQTNDASEFFSNGDADINTTKLCQCLSNIASFNFLSTFPLFISDLPP